MRRRRGFTMIELLVVMTIMVILMAIVLPGIFMGKGAADKAVARNLVTGFETGISAWEGHYGQAPPSTFAALKQCKNDSGGTPWKNLQTPSNDTNEGIECLLLALMTDEGGVAPFELKDDQIENTDVDRVGGVPKFEYNDQANEAVDPWGNPYVYIHHSQYGQKVRVKLGDAGVGRVVDVQAHKSEKSGGYHNKRGYQVFSLGPDSEPGTADDIGNWK